VPSSAARVSTSRTVEDLLFREVVDSSSPNMSVSLNNSDGGIGPAGSTAPLVFGGSISASMVGRRRSPSFLQLLLVLNDLGCLSHVSNSVVLLGLLLTQICEEGDTVLDLGIFVVSLGHLMDESSEVLEPHSGLGGRSVLSGVLPLEVGEKSLEDGGVSISQVDQGSLSDGHRGQDGQTDSGDHC